MAWKTFLYGLDLTQMSTCVLSNKILCGQRLEGGLSGKNRLIVGLAYLYEKVPLFEKSLISRKEDTHPKVELLV